MRFLLYSFFLILIFGCSSKTNQISKSNTDSNFEIVSPESVGISSERLNRIDKYFNKSISENIIPGAVTLIIKDGKIVYNKAFGNENVLEEVKFQNDNIFRIASMTKAITSLAVMMLWEEGNFSLDDPIEKFIPEFKNHRILKKFNKKDSTYTSIKANKKITIRHLLTHSSGLGYGFIDSNPEMKAIFAKKNKKFMNNGVMCFCDEDVKIENVIKNIAKYPLHHEPGKQFTYSVGLDVLGYFIELQSGMSLNDFFRKRIFDPLGMNDTQFYIESDKRERLVSVQTKKNGKWEDFSDNRFNVNYPVEGSKSLFFGGCGLTSTVTDYGKFLQMILNKGKYNGNQIIGKKTIETITEGQNINAWGSQISLAFGLLTDKDLYKGYGGSSGTLSTGGYWNTSAFADPVENIIGIIYKQTYDIGNDPTSAAYRRLVFQSIIE